MKKRKKHHDNHDRWMVSYADFVTLLFAFFVVLYSSAQVDKAKMAQLSSAITAAFQQLGVGSGSVPVLLIPGTTPIPAAHPAHAQDTAEAIRRKLEADLAEELKRHTVSLRQTSEGLVLSLREVGFFDSGSAALRASSLETFDRIGHVLASIGSNLRVEGHTDNVPIHTSQFQSNWELSTARATEIIRLLLTREGIGPERLSAAGYAEYHPIAENSSEDGRRLNRRVDIVIVAPHELTSPPATAP
ncbi:MAG TPA: flagellar motor protein MotB [Candidatus Saccharimonadales bacterium]|nr:flagellar motor protein MotB [Candidatus Saccharimonadales bacterium]